MNDLPRENIRSPAPPEPRGVAVSIVTTEHFALQGARAATISESTGRASMFFSAVSGGLVGLGLVASASQIGSAFYVFGLALLPTLAFIGWITFERLLQCGIEDHGYAQRIADIRAFYYDNAPEVFAYVQRYPAQERLVRRGLGGGRRQALRTAAGMVAVCIAALLGATAALLTSVLLAHRLLPALIVGALVAGAGALALIEDQRRSWARGEALLAQARPALASEPPAEP